MANLKNTSINDTGFFKLPAGDTAARPASPAATQLRFNTDTGQLEQFRPGLGNWIAPSNTGVIATGGDSVYDVDVEGTTYRVHVFTATGTSTFEVLQGGEVDYLVVGGGGSGGGETSGVTGSGGGGGGGIVYATKQSFEVQNYSVTVGVGGSGNSGQGTAGESSFLGSIEAFGGGAGAIGDWGSSAPASPGGGGGGGCDYGGEAAGGPQGNDGGEGRSVRETNENGEPGDSDSVRAGGGGGAQQYTTDGGNDDGGAGGDGVLTNITGISVYFSGGGAGSDDAPGGLGGGGDSALEGGGDGFAATANTGGGGGGGGGETDGQGGNGGSGIVIIRYPLRQNNPETAAGQDVGNGLVLELDFSDPAVFNGTRQSKFRGTYTSDPVAEASRTHRTGLEFGGNYYLNMNDVFVPRNGDHTILFLYKRTAQGRGGVFERRASTPRNGMSFGQGASSQWAYNIVSPSSQQLSVLFPYPATNEWYFDAGVFENGNTALGYRNGSLVGTDTGTIDSLENSTNSRDPLLIANRDFSSNMPVTVGYVAIYSRALSQSEIQDIYNNKLSWRFGL